MSGYVPKARIDALGGVIPDGTTIFIDGSGVISVDQAQLIPVPGTEGDLYFFHSGAVHVLHIGGGGKVLTSDGADPGWADTVMPMAANGVLVGTRHILDIDNSTGDVVITPSDDAIADTVHFDFALSDAILGAIRGRGITTIVLSSTVIKAITLWNGSSNNAAPAGWQTFAFDVAAWPNAIVNAAHPGGLGGSQNLWTEFPGLASTEQILTHHAFTLPDGTITAATIQISHDTWDEIYINETLIAGSGGRVNATLTVPPAVLIPGGTNLISGHARASDVVLTDLSFSYVLTVTYNAVSGSGGTGGTLPGGTEGDVLYFHGGAWQVLHVGTAGEVITSDGGDPGYALPTIEVDLSGAPVSREPRINLIPGTNVTLVVADNGATHAADVTVNANAATTLSGGQSGSVGITIPAGSASHSATVLFSPALASVPAVVLGCSDGRLIASAESVTAGGFTARLTASVALAAGTSITATLYWSLGGLRPGGKFKPRWLGSYR